MGTWGTGIFDNDDAMDWVEQMLQLKDISTLREAIRSIVDASHYLEASESCIALAAAEIIAAIKNKDYSLLPEAAQPLARNNDFIVDAQLIELALKAIQAISSDSELRDLWSESEFLGEWSNVIIGLEQRLKYHSGLSPY